ncbi:MAG: tRNA-intron lyase [Nitrososphaeria archaeon]
MAQEEKLVAELKGKNIIVKNFEAAQQLYKSGFGEKEGQKLVFTPCEGLYLCDAGKIKIHEKGYEITFDKLMDKIYKNDKSILTRFLVYRDLRTRGFVVKEGFGFGIDFRVYDRGDYNKKASKYVISALNEGNDYAFSKIFQDIRDIRKMGKESIIAVVDRRGEIIYYQLSEETFNAKR